MHADKGLLERVKRRRVDHLLLDLGRVGAPGHEEELGAERGLRALSLDHVVVVVDGVPAIVVVAVLDLKVIQKGFVRIIARAGLKEENKNKNKFQRNMRAILKPEYF